MAGSYSHIVNAAGKLRPASEAADMLEGASGDALECIEELFGMVWYLAQRLHNEHPMEDTKYFVHKAIEHYKDGLRFSGSEGWL